MNLILDDFTHFLVVDDLPELLRRHVVEVVPLELGLLFNFPAYVFKVEHLSKLAQGGHGVPESLLNHLAEVEHHFRQMGPTFAETDLE